MKIPIHWRLLNAVCFEEAPASRLQTSVDAALTGEPEDPTRIEGGGVQIDTGSVLRQGIARDAQGRRLHPHDGEPPAFACIDGAVSHVFCTEPPVI